MQIICMQQEFVKTLAQNIQVDRSKIRILTLIPDILLMVEKRVRDGICHFINRYVKAKYKYMKVSKQLTCLKC